MHKLYQAAYCLLASCMAVSGSENGKYYICNAETLASENRCIFEFSGDQPADWVREETHDLDRTVGENFHRGVENYQGNMLPVSPRPWTNGDKLVGTSTAVTGDEWSGYALIFELMAPLRDMMMYSPDELIGDEDYWLKWTRALTECNSKIVDGDSFSTSHTYEILKNPNHRDSHNTILRYLEEGTMDLVCLSTDLKMSPHCDEIREAAGAVRGVDRCNCWFDAYKALYGECPVLDMEFTTCSKTVGTLECA